MPSSKHAPPAASLSRLAAMYAAPRPVSATAAPAPPQLSAWERWEMNTIGDPAARSVPVRKADERVVLPLAPSPPSVLIEAELRRLRLEAHAIGEAAGRTEGWSQGHAEGHTAGLASGLAAATAHAEQLRALTLSLPDALRRAETEVSEALLTLALDIARQVVHRTLRAEPEWLLPLVQDLLHAEPALGGEPRLLLHPEDVALVKNSLGNELQLAGWQVRADDAVQRGGCRVQSATGEVDATLETRWKNVNAALRRDVDAQAV